MTDVATTQRSRAADESELHQYRRELTGYCYRMLGSSFDAEDAVQDTMVRAWRALDRFDGRSSLRSWLYRIATNVCLDMIKGKGRRATPMDMSPTASPPVQASLGTPHPDRTWVEPILDARVVPTQGDPAELAVARESVRLAFVAALQHLPPKQRAVLILREVLRWKADEVAQLLDTTVASVNSALQRARASLEQREPGADARVDDVGDADPELLERYVDAFERYDMDALVAVLHEDATQNMPPFAMWLQGRDDIVAWMLGPGQHCRGSRLVPLDLNGEAGYAQYRWIPEAGRHEPWAIQALRVRGERVVAITSFLDTNLFEQFGLPSHLEPGAPTPTPG